METFNEKMMRTLGDETISLLETMDQYVKPEAFELGSIVALTGHCTSGCDHDTLVHPNEYKSSS